MEFLAFTNASKPERVERKFIALYYNRFCPHIHYIYENSLEHLKFGQNFGYTVVSQHYQCKHITLHSITCFGRNDQVCLNLITHMQGPRTTLL
jgi:hypothetical protein